MKKYTMTLMFMLFATVATAQVVTNDIEIRNGSYDSVEEIWEFEVKWDIEGDEHPELGFFSVMYMQREELVEKQFGWVTW